MYRDVLGCILYRALYGFRCIELYKTPKYSDTSEAHCPAATVSRLPAIQPYSPIHHTRIQPIHHTSRYNTPQVVHRCLAGLPGPTAELEGLLKPLDVCSRVQLYVCIT